MKMIIFEGLVTGVTKSKDGSKVYAEMADRETFQRYNVTLPGTTQLDKGEIVKVQIVSVRAFQNRLSFEAELLPVTDEKEGSK
jgi:hypothetical protein